MWPLPPLHHLCTPPPLRAVTPRVPTARNSHTFVQLLMMTRSTMHTEKKKTPNLALRQCRTSQGKKKRNQNVYENQYQHCYFHLSFPTAPLSSSSRSQSISPSWISFQSAITSFDYQSVTSRSPVVVERRRGTMCGGLPARHNRTIVGPSN